MAYEPGAKVKGVKHTSKAVNKNTQTASAMDVIIQIAPHAGEIGEALMYGTGALGAGATGYMGNKARKLRKKHDLERDAYRKARG